MAFMKEKLRFMMHLSGVLLTLAGGVSCSTASNAGKGRDDKTLGGKTYQIVVDDGLTGSDQELKGSGTVLFRDPLGEVGGEKNLALDFSLEDGGSLSLIAYADPALKNGVTLTFLRNGRTLNSTIEVGSQKNDPRTVGSVDASGSIQIDIDVHNTENPIHILAWSRGVNSYTDSTAAFDSEVGPSVQGNGTAAFWGIRLVKGTLSKAVVTEAKFAD